MDNPNVTARYWLQRAWNYAPTRNSVLARESRVRYLRNELARANKACNANERDGLQLALDVAQGLATLHG